MQRGECRRWESSLCSHTLYAKYCSTSATARVQESFDEKNYSRVLPIPSSAWPLDVLPILHPLLAPQYPPVDALSACPGLSHTVHFPCSGNTPHWEQWGVCVTRHLNSPRHRRLCLDRVLTVTGTQAAFAASFQAGEMLSYGPHPGSHRSRGDRFSFLRLWCCSIKFWALMLCKVWPLHRWVISGPSSSCTHSSFNKTAVNSKLFSWSQSFVLFEYNMLPCEGVEKWPHHEAFKKEETIRNRKQKLPPHLPHHFIAFTSVIVIHPHYSQQRTQSLCGSFHFSGRSYPYGCISG